MSPSLKPKSYRLTTIEDVFVRVPAARIPTCCAEIGMLLASTKATCDALVAAAKQMGVKVNAREKPCVLTFPITWTDDGAGHCETQLTADVPGRKRPKHVLSVVVQTQKS